MVRSHGRTVTKKRKSCDEETDAAKTRKNEANGNSNGTKATHCNDNEKQGHDAAVRRGGSGPSASIHAAGSNPDFIFPIPLQPTYGASAKNR